MTHGVTSGLSKNTFRMAGASLFADMATEILTPVWQIFLTQTLNATGSIVGLVDGIAQAIRNVIDGFSGPISDTLHRRRSTAIAGYQRHRLVQCDDRVVPTCCRGGCRGALGSSWP